MANVRDLQLLSDKLNRVVDAADSVRMCANFIRRHEEKGRKPNSVAGTATGDDERNRLVRQLLDAEDRLTLAVAAIK